MKVFVDDLLVKRMEFERHKKNLREAFGVLCQYKIKLNPMRCAFRVQSSKFLGFMVSKRGIEQSF